MGNDELEEIVKQLELGPEQVDEALGQAFEKSANHHVQNEIATISETKLYSISDLIAGITKVAPEKRKDLIKSLLAQHYGNENQSLVQDVTEYAGISDQLALLPEIRNRFADNVKEYQKLKPNSRKYRKLITNLDAMGLVSDSSIYLTAMQNVHQLFRRDDFVKNETYRFRYYFKKMMYFTAAATTGAIAFDIYGSHPGISTPIVFFVGLLSSAVFADFTSVRNPNNLYLPEKTKHIAKHIDAATIDTPVALHLAKEMQHQLKNPTTYNAQYSKQEIAAERELGLQYFGRTIPLLEKLNGSN
tara:strand:- start:8685 stop:9590 length:906 start_codon:yes stop_codon:yes gene_type:complete